MAVGTASFTFSRLVSSASVLPTNATSSLTFSASFSPINIKNLRSRRPHYHALKYSTATVSVEDKLPGRYLILLRFRRRTPDHHNIRSHQIQENNFVHCPWCFHPHLLPETPPRIHGEIR
ncbi:hypothetical protein L1987_75988 [Smallanthus sonchifolius]|uniref:Uncharacterized protein n=1 Tax=Smallanthus sonchifolius TaxID=185202 RepID=A0ACB9A7B5_9ASTR|nr:hypothetical protein L1987_75988 [Smallanthus sonchifolius]